jgi:hypothetical protein
VDRCAAHRLAFEHDITASLAHARMPLRAAFLARDLKAIEKGSG